MANSFQDVIRRARKSWGLLAQTTIWVTGALAAFLLPPPGTTLQEGQIWLRFGQFVITVIIGLVVLAGMRWGKKQHMLGWAGSSLLFLGLSAGAFLAYQVCQTRWTANYNNQRVVVGDTLTPFGREYLQAKPESSSEDLVMDVSGKTEKIWTRQSIEGRRFRLAALYLVSMPLFTVCLMSLVQAIQCADVRAARRRQKAPPPKPDSVRPGPAPRATRAR